MLGQLADFDWLVVTSANGAEAVGDFAAGVPSVRLAAVGMATAAALGGRAGRPVDLVPEQANSDGLLAAFPMTPSRVLLAQADRAGEHLATGLRAAGHDVVAVEAYVTRPLLPDATQLDQLAGADAVVLASGSAVEAWSRAIAQHGCRAVTSAIITIGRRTADVAAANGLPVSAAADAPTDDAIVAAVVGALPVR